MGRASRALVRSLGFIFLVEGCFLSCLVILEGELLFSGFFTCENRMWTMWWASPSKMSFV